LDARDGKMLWKSMLGGQVANGPITYAVNGKQYVSWPPETAVYLRVAVMILLPEASRRDRRRP
jgi:hypothetical protein